MRLLLDQHLTPVIAERLRESGHDVLAVAEVGLAGTSDSELLAFAAAEGRALVTANVRHFAPLARRFAEEGTAHEGLVFHAGRAAHARGATSELVRVLAHLLSTHPAYDALADRIVWLARPGPPDRVA